MNGLRTPTRFLTFGCALWALCLFSPSSAWSAGARGARAEERAPATCGPGEPAAGGPHAVLGEEEAIGGPARGSQGAAGATKTPRIEGRVRVARPASTRGFSGTFYLLVEIDRSLPAAYVPPETSGLAVTARDGRFELEPLPWPAVITRAFREGLDSGPLRITLPRGDGDLGELVLRRAPGLEVVPVRVTEKSSGRPLAWTRFFFDARPHASLEEAAAGRPLKTGPLVFYVTGPDGRCHLPWPGIEVPRRRPLYVSFFKRGYVPQSVRLSSFPPRERERDALEVALERGGGLRGRLPEGDAFGLPADPHFVLRRRGPPAEKAVVRVPPDGAFELDGLPPGRYLLRTRTRVVELRLESGEITQVHFD